MKAIIVGYGSIGARHARLLAEHGSDIVCVTSNNDCPFRRVPTIEQALSEAPAGIVIVANATAQHVHTLRGLARAGFAGRLLVEKPLTGTGEPPPLLATDQAYVAYNLRFHPLVQELRAAIAGRRLTAANFYSGMYLPDWRPASDYRLGYSAKRTDGGGVLRDLSHELDLANWVCGGWLRVAAVGGHFSNLEIDSDDAYALLIQTENCPMVSIQVNYLDRMPRRTIVINADGLTVTADLVNGRLDINGTVREMKLDRDTTYRAQLDALLSGCTTTLCTIAEGAMVDQLVVAAESASARKCWVERIP